MDDNQETGLATHDVLPAGPKQSEAAAEEKSQVAADTGTEDKPEGEEAAGAEQAASAEPPEGSDETDEIDEDEKPKRRRSGSDRLKRRIAYLEAELQDSRSRVSTDGVVPQDVIEKEIGSKPKEEDFKGDFLAFERAMTAYELDARQAAREIRRAYQIAQTSRALSLREARAEHNERIEEFRQKVPDFDETLKAAANLKTAPAVESLILESDNSAHLVYHLAKNPDRLDRLNRMSERDAAREIGRIEARLSLPQPKTQTQAPKPVVPPKGGSAAPSQEKRLESYLARIYGKRA